MNDDPRDHAIHPLPPRDRIYTDTATGEQWRAHRWSRVSKDGEGWAIAGFFLGVVLLVALLANGHPAERRIP